MPTVIIPDRICSHCGGNKWYVDSRGMTSCWYKVRATAKKFADGDKENAKKRRHSYYIANKEKEFSKCIKWQKDNKEVYKPIRERAGFKYRKSHKGVERFRTYEKRMRDILSDSYVKRRIVCDTGVSTLIIEQEQVNNYRQYLKTLRKWKELKEQLQID